MNTAKWIARLMGDEDWDEGPCGELSRFGGQTTVFFSMPKPSMLGQIVEGGFCKNENLENAAAGLVWTQIEIGNKVVYRADKTIMRQFLEKASVWMDENREAHRGATPSLVSEIVEAGK